MRRHRVAVVDLCAAVLPEPDRQAGADRQAPHPGPVRPQEPRQREPVPARLRQGAVVAEEVGAGVAAQPGVAAQEGQGGDELEAGRGQSLSEKNEKKPTALNYFDKKSKANDKI